MFISVKDNLENLEPISICEINSARNVRKFPPCTYDLSAAILLLAQLAGPARARHGSISADFNPLGFSKSHLASEGRTRVSERVTRGSERQSEGDPRVNPRGARIEKSERR